MSASAPSTGDVTDAVTSGISVETVLASQHVTTTGPKVTAAQIEKGCPARLQLIGEDITKRFNEAIEQAKLLDDQVIELKMLIAEAKDLCDAGGFDAFREKFFPNLGKSRVYELLAIATDKKSAERTKASTRERVAKHRAKKPEAPDSVTVTEKSEPKPEAQGVPAHDSKGGTASIVPGPAERRSAGTLNDTGISRFNSYVMELLQRIANHKAEHFAATAVPAEKLAKLGKFFSVLADL
jgi:hypothetical protein